MNSDRLAAALRRLVDEGGTHNRLVLQQGHAWFVASAAHGAAAVAVDAAASHYLDGRFKLDAARTSQLRTRGFAPNPPLRCLRRDYPVADLKRAAVEMLALLRGVYEAAGPCELSVQAGDVDTTENPRVLLAMKSLAEARDQEARFVLYRALLSATLLVPVERGELLVVGDLAGFEVFGAFTDATMLERYDPRGLPVERLSGRRLIGRLLERKVGSLLINPGGTVRGEIYRNEIESIAASVAVAPKRAND